MASSGLSARALCSEHAEVAVHQLLAGYDDPETAPDHAKLYPGVPPDAVAVKVTV